MENISKSKKMTFLRKHGLSGTLYSKASIPFSGIGPLLRCPTTRLTSLPAVSSLPLLPATGGEQPVPEPPTKLLPVLPKNTSWVEQR